MQDETYVDGLSNPIKAVLFDKDGTLLDFTGMWGFWTDCVLNDFRKQLATRGLRIDTDEFPQIWGTFHDDQGRMNGYDVRGPLAMGTMDEVYAVLTWHGYRAGLSWAEAKIMVRECLAQAEEEMEQHRPARPLPGVQEFLEKCRTEGVVMGVVTADDTPSAIKHLQWMGLDSFFDVVIGTDLVERGNLFPICFCLPVNGWEYLYSILWLLEIRTETWRWHEPLVRGTGLGLENREESAWRTEQFNPSMNC